MRRLKELRSLDETTVRPGDRDVGRLLVGAAAKGDPRAPELSTPRTITNLTRATGSQRRHALTWSRPTEYVDGRALKDLASFVIFRKEVSAELS